MHSSSGLPVRMAAGILAAALLTGVTALPGPDAPPAEPSISSWVDPASGTVSVFPAPGTTAASPASQLSFRGVDAAALGTVRVHGSRSGAHEYDLLAHSDGDGVSVIPRRTFHPGEQVTVATAADVRGASGPAYRFTVAVPRARPPLPIPPVRTLPDDAPVRRYVSAPGLEPPVVDVDRPVVGAADGVTVVGVKNGFGQKGPMLVDHDGEPVWFRPLTGVDARDVKVQRWRGEPALTWWEGRQPAGYGFGEVVVVDDTYAEVARFGTGNGYDADAHEVLLTPEGTALLLAYEPVAMDLSHLGGPRHGEVLDNVVQEIDVATGAVLFEWHTLGTIALEESYLDAGDGDSFDYAHLNSIAVDDDGDLLVSARHTCAVYKIDRRTASVRWRLGGRASDFAMADDAAFLKQHDARRSADGTLTLFDNGGTCGDRTRESSRGIALAVDEARGTAELVREYVHPDDLFAASQGSFQELPGGNVLLGWGSLPQWTEMSADGDVVLDATVPDDLVVTSYRARRSPWQAAAPQPPSAVLVTDGPAGPAVHVSWNGATDVAAWRVVVQDGEDDRDQRGDGADGGPADGGAADGVGPAIGSGVVTAGAVRTDAATTGASAEPGTPVGQAQRTGFETVVPLDPVWPAGELAPAAPGGERPGLVVEALGADGAVLGTAPVARAALLDPGGVVRALTRSAGLG